VVADEIAKLADKTTLSANEIANFINEGRGEVDRGKHFVDETSRAFAVIIENIKNTDKHVRHIADLAQEQDVASDSVLNHTKQVMEMSEKISMATKEQGQTNREMLSTIETITHLTQSVAANAEEIASTSEEIGAQAFSLHKEIEFFKV
jgi:methyl-accepting chemotaxis protein